MTTQESMLAPRRGTLAGRTWILSPRAMRLALVSLLGVCLMSALYLYLVSTQATLSYQLRQATEEHAKLVRTRQEKFRQLSSMTNPQRMDRLASQQGFREPEHVLYINSSAPVMESVTEQRPPNTGPGTPAAATDWWETLTTQILTLISEPPSSARP